MYTSFTAKNFRCFEDMKIEPLARVNLICGGNGIGKSTTLDALFLNSGFYKPEILNSLNHLRGLQKVIYIPGIKESPWDNFFRNFETEKEIQLNAEIKNIGHSSQKLKIIYDNEERQEILRYFKDPNRESKREFLEKGNSLENQKEQPQDYISKGYMTTDEGEKVLVLNTDINNKPEKRSLILDKDGIFYIWPPSKIPPFNTTYRPSFIEMNNRQLSGIYVEIRKTGESERLLKFLKILKPDLKSIEMLLEGNDSIPYVDIGLKRPIPLWSNGGGIVYLFFIFCLIFKASNGVVLIDEIENGFHHSIMDKVWKEIDITSQYFNTQVFATTHSRECIVAAHKSFSESKDYDHNFRLHRLEMIKDKIQAITYDKKSLAGSIKLGWEIR